MTSFTKREQIVILILVVVIVFTLCYSFFSKSDLKLIKANETETNIDDGQNNSEVENNEVNDDSKKKKEERKIIMVDISGQVNCPGLFQLYEDDRVIDAVNKAGGLKPDCDRDRINLARRVEDEEKIYIPKIGEALDAEIQYLSTVENNSMSEAGKVNINTASKEKLVDLPGIGDALADRIIQYRNENKFENIEEIMQVSGIGDKKFEGIKDFISVN